MQSVSMDAYKIAVIGDVHSNSLVLKASLKSILGMNFFSPVDTIVLMGI